MITEHTKWMQLALDQAKLGLYSTQPNPMVGCAIVNAEGQAVLGHHICAGCAHAEINAIEKAQQQNMILSECTVFVTLEPCAHQGRTGACALALIEAGIKHVVVATEDPNPLVAGKGVRLLQEAGINVEVGVLKDEAQKLNAGFFKRMQQQRPLVRVKVAMSIDGKIALASGESQWITNEKARLDVQHLRARSTAIVTGAGTIKFDNPKLNVRNSAWTVNCKGQPYLYQPKLFILDSSLSLDTASYTVFDNQRETYRVSHQASEDPKVLLCREREGKVDLDDFLSQLASDFEVNDVLVEAGPTLTNAFLSAELADELIIYIGAKVLGQDAHLALDLPMVQSMSDAPNFELQGVERFDSDIRLIYKRTGL